MNAFKKLLFVVNYGKPNAEAMLKKLGNISKKMGISYDSISGNDDNVEAKFKDKDACCVIGGDGTILSCVKNAVKYNVPVFGINLGKLGFLANISDKNAEKSFQNIMLGKCDISQSSLLEGKFGKKTYLALNDFVIKGKSQTNILALKVFANGEFVADYSGDGLIFATATGSTAYNLSAGGPLIHPNTNVFVMTSICPHTLSNRSLVFDASTNITVQCMGKCAIVAADGRDIANLKPDMKFDICTSQNTISFLRNKNHSHFVILRNKLAWSENPRNI